MTALKVRIGLRLLIDDSKYVKQDQIMTNIRSLGPYIQIFDRKSFKNTVLDSILLMTPRFFEPEEAVSE